MALVRSTAARAGHTARGVPFYPALITGSFVLNVWASTSLDAGLLPRPTAVALIAGAAITLICAVLVRHRDQGGVIAGLIVVGLTGGDDLRVIGLVGCGLAVTAAIIWRDRTRSSVIPWRRATVFLNLIAVVLVAIVVAESLGRLTRPQPALPRPLTAAVPTGARAPDIVIILLDAHGRADSLQEAYDEDISGFVDALTARGFDVSERSRSNYMATQLSLTSMFNHAHLADLGLPAVSDSAYVSALRSTLQSNRAFATMRSAGYWIGAVSPGFDGLAIRSADAMLDGGQVTELEGSVILNSVLRRGLRTLAPDSLAAQIRDRVRWNLTPSNWLSAMPADGRPRFMFVHVPSPHLPYVFDRVGAPGPDQGLLLSDVSIGAGPVEIEVRAYAEQLAYVDMVTVRAVDEVLLALPSAIVIVMGDHGPDAHIDWDHLTAAGSRERFDTFFAARTPGAKHLFGDSPTFVNVFPLLFNRYLGTDIALESSSSFLGIPPRHALVDIGNPDALP